MCLYSWVYVYSTGMVETIYNDTHLHVSSQSYIQWCCLTHLKLTVASKISEGILRGSSSDVTSKLSGYTVFLKSAWA